MIQEFGKPFELIHYMFFMFFLCSFVFHILCSFYVPFYVLKKKCCLFFLQIMCTVKSEIQTSFSLGQSSVRCLQESQLLPK